MLRIFLVIDDYNELIYLQSLLKKMGFDVEGLQNQKKYADVSLGFNPQVLIATAKGQKVDGLALAKTITKRRGIPKIMALRTPSASFDQAEFERAGVDQVLDSPINPRKLLIALAALGGLDETALVEKYNKIKNSLMTDVDAQQALTHDDSDQAPDIQQVKQALEKAARDRGEAPPSFSVKTEDTTEPITSAGGAARFPLADTVAEPASIDRTDPIPQVGVGSRAAAVAPEAIAVRKDRFEKSLKEIGRQSGSHFNRDRISDFNKKIRAAGTAEDIDRVEAERKEYVRALFTNKK